MDIFLYCLHIKWLRIILIPSISRAEKEAYNSLFTYEYVLYYLVLWILMSACSGWKRGYFWSVTPFDQEANPCPYCMGQFMYKRHFNNITRELRFNKTNTTPYVDKFGKIIQMVKACTDHITSIFLAS